MTIILDLDTVYRAHNDERRKIGKLAIKRDYGLEKIIKADASSCRNKHGSSIDSQVLTYCGKHYPGSGRAENLSFGYRGTVKSRVKLPGWISEKKYLTNGRCLDGPNWFKCGHYQNAFQTGKAVGCAVETNCFGSWPVIISCVYCK